MELSDSLLKVLSHAPTGMIDFNAYLKTHPQLGESIEQLAHAPGNIEACVVMSASIAWVVNAILNYGVPHDLPAIPKLKREGTLQRRDYEVSSVKEVKNGKA